MTDFVPSAKPIVTWFIQEHHDQVDKITFVWNKLLIIKYIIIFSVV